ncbi:MAG: GGDEF domain-containing response regulator [Planctomycetota bacterium]
MKFPTRADPGGHVLVAEDDRFYRRILAKRLEAEGHRVTLTANGGEAWEAIRLDRPNLLLSDWMMPLVDGYELCRRVKSDPKLRSIYCILLTAKDQTEDKVSALDLGADEYVVKPCDERELMAHVRRGLRTQRRTQRLEEQSITDPLTQLRNRRCLDQRMAEEVSRSRRSGTPLSLVYIDLDHFKRVNDRFGHLIGDEVLTLVGKTLHERVRLGEVAARIGGDEFAVLLPDTKEKGARAFAAWVERAIAALRLDRHGCADLALGCSTGCAELEAVGDSASLMRAADDALYRRKRERRVLSS